MMLIFRSLIFAMLYSSTGAWMRGNGDATLGEDFLAVANNNTNPKPTQVVSKDASYNAEVKGEHMDSLYTEIVDLCNKQGNIDYSNSYSDSTTGMMENFGLSCRFKNNDGTYEVFWEEAMSAVNKASPSSTSFSTNSYTNSIPDYGNQKKALEMLIKQANSIEEVMLVVPTWQNVASNYPMDPGSSSISININKRYEYSMGPSWAPTESPMALPFEENEELQEAEEVQEAETKSGGK